jgi:hypothetical protein
MLARTRFFVRELIAFVHFSYTFEAVYDDKPAGSSAPIHEVGSQGFDYESAARELKDARQAELLQLEAVERQEKTLLRSELEANREARVQLEQVGENHKFQHQKRAFIVLT